FARAEISFREVDFGHGRPPAVGRAMPLGANVVDVPDDSLSECRNGVGVEDAVMTLMPCGEELAGLFAHTAHFLTFGDVVGHQLFGEDMLSLEHGINGGVAMEPEGKSD